MTKKIIIGISSICVLAIGYFVLDHLLFTGVRPRLIEEQGFQAKFYSRDSIENKPAVIVVGGGEWGDYWGQEFAKQGYSCLSLPYYRMKGMPQLMEKIPLEYFERAITWLSKQPQVNPKKLIVMGASRNAELALLIAATFPTLVDGVIAYSPSAVSWSNTVLPFNSDQVKASWTYNKQAVPYISMKKIRPADDLKVEPLSYWKSGLLDSLQVEQACIKVERIRGPILLFSGADDSVWPSTLMSQMIARRLKEHNFKSTLQNIIYENAGHMISGDPNRINPNRKGQMVIEGKSYEYEYGGTAEGDNLAQRDAKEKVFAFISKL